MSAFKIAIRTIVEDISLTKFSLQNNRKTHVAYKKMVYHTFILNCCNTFPSTAIQKSDIGTN